MSRAAKYNVGKMSRKDIMNAIEHILEMDEVGEGQSIVRINNHRGKQYEIRARRKPHGIDLDWGLPGTFYCPHGYDNVQDT